MVETPAKPAEQSTESAPREGSRWRARESLAPVGASERIKKTLEMNSAAKRSPHLRLRGMQATGLGDSGAVQRALDAQAARVAQVSYSCCFPSGSTPSGEGGKGTARESHPPAPPRAKERAREFAFPLDPFQEAAISCLHKEETRMRHA